MSESPHFFGECPWSFVVLVQVPPEAHHISLQHAPLLRASHPGKPISEEETNLFHHRRVKGKVVKPKAMLLLTTRFDTNIFAIRFVKALKLRISFSKNCKLRTLIHINIIFIIFDNLKDVRPEGWGLTPPYLDYLESEHKSATSTNANGDLKKLFPPAYFVRLVGRLTHSLQVYNKSFSHPKYMLQVCIEIFS